MIRHIVMWKFNDELSKKDIEHILQKGKAAVDDMNGNIKGLISAQLGKNVNDDESYDLVLCCEFENLEDINSYQTNPLHLCFKDVVVGKVHDRACIDCKLI